MRIGVAHHFGWAVVVTASAEFDVVDRRRIELIEPGLPVAPIHHEGGAHPLHASGRSLDHDALARLAAKVRASSLRAASAALDDLAAAVPVPITAMSLRAWPADFPTDIAMQRRVPYESEADSVMYRQVLAELAGDRGLAVHLYDAKSVEQDAIAVLGDRAEQVLQRPRAQHGPPWTKDHRTALAAIVIATTTHPQFPAVANDELHQSDRRPTANELGG